MNIHKHYHAHLYFDNKTLQFARNLCEQAGKLFNLKV
ncbi:MAG: 4,5-dioxygenase, partial [Pseudomonadales bacterium]|nr:4,5-dioxygenase [Pseudomonadales bacterium]